MKEGKMDAIFHKVKGYNFERKKKYSLKVLSSLFHKENFILLFPGICHNYFEFKNAVPFNPP